MNQWIKKIVYCGGILSIGVLNAQVAISVKTNMGTKYDYGHSVVFQTDGKIIAAGDAYGFPFLVRYDTSGVLDPSFGTGGKVLIQDWACGSNPADNQIQVLQDGKILLGTYYYNGTDDDFVVAKFLQNGSPDSSFGIAGKVVTPIGIYNDRCNAMTIQPDGKIILAGGKNNAPNSNYYYDLAMVRYKADGTVDTTFGTNGVVITHVPGPVFSIAYDVMLLPDGKIMLAGEGQYSNYSTDKMLVRYNTDGSVDATFGNAGIAFANQTSTLLTQASMALLSDGKLLLVTTSSSSPTITRFNADGSIDNLFGTNGTLDPATPIGIGNGIVVQPDDKLLLATLSYDLTTGLTHMAVMRLNPDGTIDNSFGTNGIMMAPYTNSFTNNLISESIAFDNNGNIAVVGMVNQGPPIYYDLLVGLFYPQAPVGLAGKKDQAKDLYLFPNPSTGTFFLKGSEKCAVEILDELGRTITMLEMNEVNNFSIRVCDLQPGIYFVCIPEQAIQRKIIVCTE